MSFLESIADPKGSLHNDNNFRRYWNVWKEKEDSYTFIPLAEIIRTQGFLSEAQEVCEKGLSHHPESVSAHVVLAKIYRDMGDLIKLRELLAKAYEMAPQNEDIVSLSKEFNIEMPKFEEEPSEDPKDSPDQPWETVTMAQIYANQGEVKKGIKTLNKILKNNPDDQRAKEMLVDLKQRPKDAQ
jgi:tetratricopeptide (TPR) repeat protein